MNRGLMKFSCMAIFVFGQLLADDKIVSWNEQQQRLKGALPVLQGVDCADHSEIIFEAVVGTDGSVESAKLYKGNFRWDAIPRRTFEALKKRGAQMVGTLLFRPLYLDRERIKVKTFIPVPCQSN